MQRVTLRLLFALAIFATASQARAAAVDLVLWQVQFRDGTDWSFTVNVNSSLSVSAVAVETSSSLTGFTFASSNPGISLPDSAFFLDPIGDGRNVLIINMVVPSGPPLAGPFTFGVPLGTFSSSGPPASVQLFPGDDFAGFTVLDQNFDLVSDWSITVVHIVPEPGVSALLLLAALAAASRAARRRD
jgi:hypothetical protein